MSSKTDDVSATPEKPDPIFAAIDIYRRADAACIAVPKGADIPDALMDRRGSAFDAVIRTRPTTPAGLAALTQWVREQAEWLRANGSMLHATDFYELSATIDDAVRGMSGLQPWSSSDESEFVAIGHQYKVLLDRYIDAKVAWHAAPPKSVDYREADNAISRIAKQMAPLEEMISNWHATSIEEIRVVALKDLKHKLKPFHDEHGYSDGCRGDLELFWQVLRATGLHRFACQTEDRIKSAIACRQEA